ncbi:hypothetical protein V1512DRAFT_210710 [Lipomyces arxii]|uniref:uncharacterized protein n=1 Tax=Lipomyces arxii TaxID=56418 RepID=UPI0034CF84A1
MSVAISSKRRRGRPRLNADEEQTDRRRAQIRDAQRTYRQKKDSTIKILQDRVRHLESSVDQLQVLFFGVYRDGMQFALEQQNSLVINNIALTAGRVLDVIRGAIEGHPVDSETRVLEGGSFSASEALWALHSKENPTFFVMREALTIPVTLRAGSTYAEKVTEAVYRTSCSYLKISLESHNAEAIKSIFPQGVDEEEVICSLKVLDTTQPLETLMWDGKNNDDTLYPGWVSPRGVGARVAHMMSRPLVPGQPRTFIDGDKLVAFLFGRFQCKGKVPRFKSIDVDIGFLVAKREVIL